MPLFWTITNNFSNIWMAKLGDTWNNFRKTLLLATLEKGGAYLFYSQHLIKENGTNLINNFFMATSLVCNSYIGNLAKLQHLWVRILSTTNIHSTIVQKWTLLSDICVAWKVIIYTNAWRIKTNITQSTNKTRKKEETITIRISEEVLSMCSQIHLQFPLWKATTTVHL